MNIHRFIVFLTLLLFSVEAFAIDSNIETYLRDKEITTDSNEYLGARKLINADLNGDKKEDILLQYTLEHGNNYVFLLAAFLYTDGEYVFASDTVAGGKFSRSLEFLEVENRVIKFKSSFRTIRSDGTWDPTCCPSGEGEAYYTLIEGQLVELNSSGEVPVDFGAVLKR